MTSALRHRLLFKEEKNFTARIIMGAFMAPYLLTKSALPKPNRIGSMVNFPRLAMIPNIFRCRGLRNSLAQPCKQP